MQHGSEYDNNLQTMQIVQDYVKKCKTILHRRGLKAIYLFVGSVGLYERPVEALLQIFRMLGELQQNHHGSYCNVL